jgi:VCBS repeat protein
MISYPLWKKDTGQNSQRLRHCALAALSGLFAPVLEGGGGNPNPLDFASIATFPLGELPISIAVAELTGDAFLDAAVANLGSDSISVLQGAGNGSFAPLSTIKVEDRPRVIIAADLNGDGRADLAVGHYSSGNILSILASQGSFMPAATVYGAPELGALVAADFDQDGAQDLATVDTVTDRVLCAGERRVSGDVAPGGNAGPGSRRPGRHRRPGGGISAVNV